MSEDKKVSLKIKKSSDGPKATEKDIDSGELKRNRNSIVNKFKPYTYLNICIFSLFDWFRSFRTKTENYQSQNKSYSSVKAKDTFERFKDDEKKLLKEVDIVSILNSIKHLKETTKKLTEQIEQKLDNKEKVLDSDEKPDNNLGKSVFKRKETKKIQNIKDFEK